MNTTGKLHEVGETIQVGDKFKKREIVVAYAENPQFVEYVKFELQQENATKADNLSVGDEVSVEFNLRGRPWTNKDGVTTYFNSLVAWKINKLSSAVEDKDNSPF